MLKSPPGVFKLESEKALSTENYQMSMAPITKVDEIVNKYENTNHLLLLSSLSK